MVAAGFTLRKIRTVHTLGEKLKRARKRKGIDLIEAELQTKVRAKYLEALENEDFDLLPNDIYVKGFIITYANYLGLNPDNIFNLYRQQRAIKKNTEDDDFSQKKVKSNRVFIITPKIIALSFGVLFCCAAILYIILQVVSFASVPKLVVTSPNKDMVVETESVLVSGATDASATLLVNKEKVATNEDGSFKKEITLQNGINTIMITAIGKTNKESSKVIIIERKIKTAEMK
ncbi:MAG: helix-turn-helix domain-containing protein [Patescibacteria group bacterium]